MKKEIQKIKNEMEEEHRRMRKGKIEKEKD